MTRKRPTSKTQTNEQFIAQERAKGRDSLLLGEFPFPATVKRCREVLAVEGNRVYLYSEEGDW